MDVNIFLLLEAAIESSKFVFTSCIKFNLQCKCYCCYCWGKAGEEASTTLLRTSVTFLGTLSQGGPLNVYHISFELVLHLWFWTSAAYIWALWSNYEKLLFYNLHYLQPQHHESVWHHTWNCTRFERSTLLWVRVLYFFYYWSKIS